jgi:lipid-A-disaccharide synthase-like uncharacterized protein
MKDVVHCLMFVMLPISNQTFVKIKLNQTNIRKQSDMSKKLLSYAKTVYFPLYFCNQTIRISSFVGIRLRDECRLLLWNFGMLKSKMILRKLIKERDPFSVCTEKQEFYDRLETSLDSKHQFGVCVFLEKRFSS